MCHFTFAKPIECTTFYVVTVNVTVNLKVSYRLLVTVMCQCVLISGNIPLWWGVLIMGSCTGVGDGGYEKSLYLCSNLVGT